MIGTFDGACNIRLAEIVPFEEQRFACRLGESVGETVAEVQLRRVPATFAEVAIGLPRDSGLRFRHWLDYQVGRPQQVVKAAAAGLLRANGRGAWELREQAAKRHDSGAGERGVHRQSTFSALAASSCIRSRDASGHLDLTASSTYRAS